MQKINIPKKSKTTVIMALTNIGSRFEHPKYKGISHFVEHMCFKGTKNRTQKEIDLGIEKYGGVINAFTDTEITAYWAKIANEYQEEATDIIMDLASNPIFPKKEVLKERKVILQELKMYEDNPEYYVDELLNKTLYKKSSGLYLPILGTKETLSNIGRKELKNYHKINYNNLVLIKVGNVQESELIVYNKRKSDISSADVNLDNLDKKFFVKRKDITQANVIIGNDINIPNNKLDNLFAFKLLKSVYSNMSGRLFTVIREKHNLVYRIHFYFKMYSCGGIKWEVDLGLEKGKINKAYDLIIKELSRPLTKKEIEYALLKEIGSMDMYLDNNLNTIKIIARSLIQDIDYKEVIYNYKKHLHRIAKSINDYQKAFNFKRNVLVGVIPE